MTKKQFDSLITADLINIINKYGISAEQSVGLAADIKGLTEHYLKFGPLTDEQQKETVPGAHGSATLRSHGQQHTTTDNPYYFNSI